jgi:hypothetical protein
MAPPKLQGVNPFVLGQFPAATAAKLTYSNKRLTACSIKAAHNKPSRHTPEAVCGLSTTAAGECFNIHGRLVVSKTVLVPHASIWHSRVSKLVHLKQQQVPGHHNSSAVLLHG